MTDGERYRDAMEGQMEALAVALDALGYKGHKKMDEELVEVAERKLKLLHSMLVAIGVRKEILDAIMAE